MQNLYVSVFLDVVCTLTQVCDIAQHVFHIPNLVLQSVYQVESHVIFVTSQ